MLLSTRSTQVVKATLPVIGAAIGDITPVFYQRMFAAHPELERDLFNRGNQAQGDQQRALAGAIAAYATLLVAEDGRDPLEILARIAHKHASLGITEDQYPIVHEHLFAAIVEVLGEAVTPEVASAWDEVFWHMAEALVTIEKRLYAETGVADGAVWRTLVLRRRRQESPDTVSFVFGSPDGSALPPSRPGQYVSLQVSLPDGAHQIRQYSLTGASQPSEWGISVKGVPASHTEDGAPVGAGQVSTFLHDNVFEGDEIRASAPFGDLVLEDSEGPLVLISAGIGITPILGILHYLVGVGSSREVLVLHADRSPARHAHRQQLKELVGAMPSATLHRWYEDLGVRATREELREGLVDLGAVDLPLDAQVYLCGPLPFMRSVHGTLVEQQHVAEADIHYEVFGPDTWLAPA
ncbi:MAG: globin domain-containing protein [Nocardioides sp.]|nr:globin domain-containing protein [Nocardioides sp.]